MRRIDSLPRSATIGRAHPPDGARRLIEEARPEGCCDINPIDNLRVLRYLTHSLGRDENDIAAWYNHWMAAGFRALELLLADDPRTGIFCHGATPGLADITLVPQVVKAERCRLDMTRYPTIAGIHASCRKLAAFAAAHPRNQPDAEP